MSKQQRLVFIEEERLERLWEAFPESAKSKVTQHYARFCQLNPAEAKAIARRNHLSISLNTGHLLPRRKGAATQDSIIRCPQQMSADAK